jgi:uncharacterized protein
MAMSPSPRRTQPGLVSSVLAASVWLVPGAGLAFAVGDVPNPRESHGGWVSDEAGILRQDTEARINGMIDALERHDGSEMMVVTVPDTSSSSSPKAFATDLFNTFRIGRKGIDNGVLMLISKGDRRVEIETGYGMEERLPDARVGAIISTSMLPRFKEGDYDGGTLAGVREVIGTLSPEVSKNQPAADEHDDSPPGWAVYVFFALFVSIWVLFLALGLKYGWLSGGGGSSSDSSSDSSGGGSSGGGSSGGGGAGGSW